MKVIVDSNHYNLKDDERLLIPFVEVRKNTDYYVQKQGLLNKEGNIVVDPKYDFVVGDCFCKDELLVLGQYYQEHDNPHIFCHYDIYSGEGELVFGDVLDLLCLQTGN